jgi:Tol biopolymer transport system component
LNEIFPQKLRLPFLIIISLFFLSLTGVSAAPGDVRYLTVNAGVAIGYTDSFQGNPQPADPRYVLIRTSRSDVFPTIIDNGTTQDLFMKDLNTGAIQLISHKYNNPNVTDGLAIKDSAYSVTPDGAYVVFSSNGYELVPPGQDLNITYPDVFLWERATGNVSMVSNAPGYTFSALNTNQAISDDGNFIVFAMTSTLPKLDAMTLWQTDVFLYDRSTKIYTLISHALGDPAKPNNGVNSNPRISSDGRYIFFLSTASDAVSNNSTVTCNETGRCMELIRYDRTAKTQTRVSVPNAGFTPVERYSITDFSVSRNGEMVSFHTKSALSAADINTNSDVYKLDILTGINAAVSVYSYGTAFNVVDTIKANNAASSISKDGRYVAFTSDSINMVPGIVY